MNLGHFFHGKSFVSVKIIFLRSKFGKISPKKKPLPSTFQRLSIMCSLPCVENFKSVLQSCGYNFVHVEGYRAIGYNKRLYLKKGQKKL